VLTLGKRLDSSMSSNFQDVRAESMYRIGLRNTVVYVSGNIEVISSFSYIILNL
jgi:hypothetical protein